MVWVRDLGKEIDNTKSDSRPGVTCRKGGSRQGAAFDSLCRSASSKATTRDKKQPISPAGSAG